MSDLVRVHGCPHPFRPARFDEALPAGLTLEEIITRGLDRMSVPASLRGHGHAYVGDKYIPREEWSRVIPGHGEIVTYRVVPQDGGGGDKGVLRIILTIAVIAAAILTQQYVEGLSIFAEGGALAGMGGLAGGMAAAGVTAVGMLAVNAMVPVKPPSLPSATGEKDSATYSISGARNTLNPFGTVPILLGRHRIVPPQGGRPYTELAKNDQYVRQLFVLGYRGLALLSDFRIGETEVGQYEEMQISYLSSTTAASKPKYYSTDVSEQTLSIELKQSEGWQTRATDEECDEFSFDLAFPQGLVEYTDAGDKLIYTVKINAQYRKLGDTAWTDITGVMSLMAQSWELPRSGSRVYSPEAEGYVYQVLTKSYTVRIVKATGEVEFVSGASNYTSQHFGIATFEWNSDTKALQNIVSLLPVGATGLTVEYREIDGDDYVRMNSGTLPYGDYVIQGKQTNALRRTFKVVPPEQGLYEVRLARITADTTEDKIFDASWWATLRAIRHVNPVKVKSPVATLSLRARATGQLNGAIDELNVDAVSECYDWDWKTSAWVWRATSNPASLFRYVLQHPANTRPVPNSQIDLDKLAEWHNFCRRNGFEYNRYHDFTQSIFDTLRDIAAAGRASVARPDGKWSVVIDEPRTTIVQHFTPRNSWGFKFSKKLPRLPHAWRVRFINEEQGYQSDERIVYADGYSEANATEFEVLELPGVTDPAQVWKLARYHYACAKLRPEQYEFFADMEHIVCTRGDLIRVTHDVPLWGGASGRVKSVAGQVVTVDDVCQMVAGKDYVIRFRTQTGATILRNVTLNVGEQTVLTLSGTGSVPEKGDLFLFGELGQESTELIVKGIEPGDNLTARIIAVDYAPAVFDAGSGTVQPFDTNVSRPYKIVVQKPAKPTIGTIRSDEAVLLKNPDGSLTSRIQVAFALSSSYDTGEYWVHCQYRESGAETWEIVPPVRTDAPHVYIAPVEDGQTYEIRMRTVRDNGVASDWTPTVTHKAVGKTTRPPDVASLNVAAIDTGVQLDWSDVTVLDLSVYAVRLGASWDTGSNVYRGKASKYLHPFMAAGTHDFWVKAEDVIGKQSLNAAHGQVTIIAPSAPAVAVAVSGADVVVSWDAAVGSFPVLEYEIRVGASWAAGGVVGRAKARSLRVPGPAAGAYTYWVAAIDAAGNVGAAGSESLTITAPGQVSSMSSQVVDNNVLLRWTEPVLGSFQILEYEVRRGSTWAAATVIGRIAAEFSAIFESSGGTYKYWVAPIDTAGNFGPERAISAIVNQPPDYVLDYDQDSAFGGTKTSCILQDGYLLAPVNPTETWEGHFTTNAWSSPQAQINAGFDDYLEPTPASATYQEQIDFGGVIAATKISVTPTSEALRGSVAISCNIKVKKLSGDAWTDLGNVFEAYATSFQYALITLTFTPDGGGDDLLKVTRLNIKLAKKTISDAGMADCLAADSGGTQVNFNIAFTDVNSITVTPKAGGTAVYGLYDFSDVPNPTGFKILLYNAAGTRVNGTASWSAKGV